MGDQPTILSIDGKSRAIARAVDELRRGRCIAVATETVYGLAADATNGEAVARIFEMKNRPKFNPLICHVSSVEMALSHGVFSEAALTLARSFWPGPLSIVVPRNPNSGIHELATAGLETVALRCPDSVARKIIAEFGRPLAAPSANRSGKISPTTARHVAREFKDTDLLVIDGGPCPVGIESTIVRVDADRIVLLRPGAIVAEEIEAACNLPVTADHDGNIVAPGMLKSHYAPDSPVLLDISHCPPGAALLAFGGDDGKDRRPAAKMLNLSTAGDLREAAANLYGHLKELDAYHPQVIAVEPIPMRDLGIAINDRLSRAAAREEDHA